MKIKKVDFTELEKTLFHCTIELEYKSKFDTKKIKIISGTGVDTIEAFFMATKNLHKFLLGKLK